MSAVFLLLIAAPPFTWGDPACDSPAPSYWEMRAKAIAKGKPLVLGVGCDPPAGDWLTVRVGVPWHAWSKPCVIVARPVGGELLWLGDLPTAAGPQEIRRLLAPPAVTAPPKTSSVSRC